MLWLSLLALAQSPLDSALDDAGSSHAVAAALGVSDANDAGLGSVEPGFAENVVADSGIAAGARDSASVSDAGSNFWADDIDPRHQTVVTGSRQERRLQDSTVATEVVTRAQIEALGARDLTQVLQQHPGVELVYTNRGVGIRLQGLDPAYALILVNSQRVSGRSGAFTDLSRFALRDIERVEIVKGPAAALYGADAIGGVINLITRRPVQRFEAVARGMFGTLIEGDARGEVGSKLGPLEIQGGAGYRTRNPYDWDPSTPANSGPGIRRLDFDVDVAFRPSDDLQAWAKAAYMLTDLNAVDQNDTGATFDRYQRTEQFDTWVGTAVRFKSKTRLTVRGHYGLFRDQFLVDQQNAKALDEYSASLTRLWEGYVQVDQPIGNHELTVGAELMAEGLFSSRLDPTRVGRSRVGIFAQDTWTLMATGPKLSLEPGARVDVDSMFGAALSPRLALKVDANKSFTLRFAWGLGFRPPTFQELYLKFANAGIGYVVTGNPNLSAERSNSANISADYRLPLEGWMVTATLFHTSLSNLINVIADGAPNPDNPVTYAYENVANAYTQGVELLGRMKLSKGALLEVGYAGVDARDVTRDRQLEGRSAHRVTVQATGKYRPFGFEAVIRGTLYSARPFYLGSGFGFANVIGAGPERVVWAPAYVDLEAQISYTFRGWLKIFVNGYNLLNAGDQNFNPRPPRGVLGGVQLQY